MSGNWGLQTRLEMVDRNVNVPTWKQKLAVELKRDTRKTFILGGLLVVAGIVAGRLIVKELTPAETYAGVSAAGGGPGPSHAGLGTSVTVPAPPGRPTAGGASPASYVQQLSHNITRNIFWPNPDFFPPEPVVEPAKKVVTKVTVDARKETEAAIKAVRTQAGTLALQSTVVSDEPTAIINGRVLRVGEWINGFKVVEITSHTCALEKKGVKVILAMKV